MTSSAARPIATCHSPASSARPAHSASRSLHGAPPRFSVSEPRALRLACGDFCPFPLSTFDLQLFLSPSSRSSPALSALAPKSEAHLPALSTFNPRPSKSATLPLFLSHPCASLCVVKNSPAWRLARPSAAHVLSRNSPVGNDLGWDSLRGAGHRRSSAPRSLASRTDSHLGKSRVKGQPPAHARSTGRLEDRKATRGDQARSFA